MQDVGGEVLRSLVQIRSGHRNIGAGTIWHSDGLVVTNAHVVHSRVVGRNTISVILADGEKLDGRIVASDNGLDLAVLRIDKQGLPTIQIGDSRQLQVGEVVLAFGHPWGVLGASTSGIIIDASNRLPDLVTSGKEWIAASLHLRPGHSGGPMVNVQGQLIGINTLMNGPDVGVAIPVHVAKEFLKKAFDQKMALRV